MEWMIWYFVAGVILAILGLWFDQCYGDDPSTDKEMIKLAVSVILLWPILVGSLVVMMSVHMLSQLTPRKDDAAKAKEAARDG